MAAVFESLLSIYYIIGPFYFLTKTGSDLFHNCISPTFLMPSAQSLIVTRVRCSFVGALKYSMQPCDGLVVVVSSNKIRHQLD